MKRYARLSFACCRGDDGDWGIRSYQECARIQVMFNKQDLPEHGLHIITSVDPSFEGMVTSYFKNASKNSVEALKPLFSIFIRIRETEMSFAYLIRWELVRDDGRVIAQKYSLRPNQEF